MLAVLAVVMFNATKFARPTILQIFRTLLVGVLAGLVVHTARH